MKFQGIIIVSILFLIIGCRDTAKLLDAKEQIDIENLFEGAAKISILNFGTFHFGYTSDAKTTDFDENDKNNQEQAHDIARKLAQFKPTVILVESVPERNQILESEYLAYLNKPKKEIVDPTEIELIAFELGRLSGTKRIYGIDHIMGYNYNIGNEITNQIDSVMHDTYNQELSNYYPENFLNQDSLNLLEKLRITNLKEYLDFMIEVNADILTHVGSDEGFEGADEATKYYQRNLRMYSNLNRIKLNENDKVFILMGASHTAFFRDFISRSPKYEMVNTSKYLE